jgi:hypothetical protein
MRFYLEYLADQARRVTFWNFITSGESLLVSQTLFEKAIPTFQASMSAATKKAPSQLEPVAARVAEKRGSTAEDVPAPVPCPPKQPAPPVARAISVPAVHTVAEEASLSAKAGIPPPRPIAAAAGLVVQARAPAGDKAQMILELTVQFAYVSARCAGHLAKKQKEWIEDHFKNRYRHDPVLLNCAKAYCAHYESAALNVDGCLNRINQEFTAGHKTALVKMAFEIAATSGEINEQQRKFLQKACQRLEVPAPVKSQLTNRTPSLSQTSVVPDGPSQVSASPIAPLRHHALQPTFGAAVDRPVASPATAGGQIKDRPRALTPAVVNSQADGSTLRGEKLLVVLEIEASMPLTADLVRRHYFRLMDKFAPDKVQTLGADFALMAQKKRQEIEHAAQTLMAQWGEELVQAQPAAPELRHNPDLDALFGA